MYSGATQKHIERKEIEDMGTLICTKSRLLLNLKKVLTMSTGFSDKKLVKECQNLISVVDKECKEYLSGYDRIVETWSQLIPIMKSIEKTH